MSATGSGGIEWDGQRESAVTGGDRGLTRRGLLGGLLVATAWRLTPARAADASPAPAADGFTILEAGPTLLPLTTPAEPAAALAWSGQIPGPLLRLKRGEEAKVRLANRLAEPTMLCFPGLRPPNAAAGYGGLTTPRLGPGASADIRFTVQDAGFGLYLPHAGKDGHGAAGPRPVRSDHRGRSGKAGR